MPKTATKPAPPKHMAASMRVVASHLHMRFTDVATARESVLQAAGDFDQAKASEATLQLVRRLEKACGCTIAELAVAAEAWPS